MSVAARQVSFCSKDHMASVSLGGTSSAAAVEMRAVFGTSIVIAVLAREDTRVLVSNCYFRGMMDISTPEGSP